jgi:hypothetical protein
MALTALGLSAVGRPSNTGGSSALVELFRPLPPDRPLIIVGERDRKADGAWPGREGALFVARSVQQQLGRRVLWTLPPGGAKDVRAWALLQQPDRNCVDEWHEMGARLSAALLRDALPPEPEVIRPGAFGAPPLPLREAPECEPFPLDVLPAGLRAYVEQASWACHCPPDFVAVPLLVLAGAALGNAWHLELTESHVQTAALFAAVVGPPGSSKSPALRQVAEPLLAASAGWVEEVRKQRTEWEAQPEEGRGTPPVARRCLLDDFTTEALVPTLAGNPKGVVVLKDELAGLITGLNQYKGGRGNDRQILLQVWAGADVVVDRKGQAGQPVQVRRPFVAVVGGIQPAVLESLRLSSRGRVVEDGMLDRFLFAYPAGLPASAEDWRHLSAEAQRGWESALARLLAEPVLPGPGGWRPRRLGLTECGRQAWVAFTAAHATEINVGDIPPHLEGVWSKLRGYAARLALLLHALRWACDEPVGLDAVDGASLGAAARLVGYFKSQARKVHAALDADPAAAGAARVLRWLAEHPQVSSFSRRDLHQRLRKTFFRPAELDGPLALLEELHYLSPLPGEPRSPRWAVNPCWERRRG